MPEPCYREARRERIPYLVILGEKERRKKTVTVRNRDTGEQDTLGEQIFLERLQKEDGEKRLFLTCAGAGT